MERLEIKIFLGVTEIAGRASGLYDGLSKLGVRPSLFIIHEDRFEFTKEIHGLPMLTRVAQGFHRASRRPTYGCILRLWPIRFAVLGLLSIAAFIEALKKYDAYYFQFGISTLPRNLDLPILKLLGRKIFVVVGHGSELRPPWLETVPPADEKQLDSHGENLRRLERHRIALAKRIEALGVEVVACPTTDHYLTKPYWDIVRIGRPTPTRKDSDKAWTLSGGTLSPRRVIHVPSDTNVKGTDQIILAMSKVCRIDPSISFQVLEGLTRQQVLHEMVNSFAIIDQAWSDIPFTGIGSEAGALGVPCLSGGGWLNFWEGKLSVPERSLPWHVSDWTNPHAILRILNDKSALIDRANNVSGLLAGPMSPDAASQRYLELFKGRLDHVYLSKPTGTYQNGVGLSESQVTLNLKILNVQLHNQCL